MNSISVFLKRFKLTFTSLGIIGAGTLYYCIKSEIKDYLNTDSYSFCTIRDIRRLSPTTCLYKLEFDRPSKQYQDRPIQSVLLKHSDIQIQRHYTPIYISPTSVMLLVKYYENGEMSPWIHRKRVGDQVELRGPFLEWKWDEHRWKKVLFIVGGTGITPAYQLLSYIFQDGNQHIPMFHLMYANRSPDQILLKDELNQLQEKYPEKLKITYFVDESPENEVSSEYLIRMISLQDINYAFSPSNHVDSDTIALVCGTDGFVSYIAGSKGALHGEQGSYGGLLEKAKYFNVWKL